MKSSAAVTTVAIVLAASSASAFDNRPMQWFGQNGEIQNKPLKQSRMTYDSPDQPTEWKMADALGLCWQYCDSAAHSTPDYWLVGNVHIDETDHFTCRCYDSREGPFTYNSDSSWSSFHCVPGQANFPCYKS
jgi:hypothetical protein